MTENNNVEPQAGPPDPEAAREQELYRQDAGQGGTDRRIRVYIDHQGDLEVGSHDFPGPLARPFAEGGATEYEYFVTVPADAKDRLLLTLLAEKYRGNPDAVENFRDWCRAKEIPGRFSTWGTGHFD